MPDRAKPESTPGEIIHAAEQLLGLRWKMEITLFLGRSTGKFKFEVTYRRGWK